MKWKVGIICAGDTELEPFLPHIQDCRTSERAMLKFYEGKIGAVEVVALYSGVCKVNAAVAVQLLIDRYGVNAVINAGIAGGMDDTVQLFDTVISEKAAYYDVADDILTEFHPWLPTLYFDADPVLLAAARSVCQKTDARILFGRMVTGETFIADAFRTEINEKFAPLSVDMETASVAHVCYVNQVPFIAIRTITDTAVQSGIENFDQNCEAAAKIAKHIVLLLLEELDAQQKRGQHDSEKDCTHSEAHKENV